MNAGTGTTEIFATEARRTVLGFTELNRCGALAVALAVLTLGFGAPGPAYAAEPGKACARGPAALGVSRVVEIDTAEGPQFGLQQYKFHDFLEPGEVVLTFDDGPLRPYTTAVLNALDAHCAKATFFNVGKMALADPEMVKEIERRGHTVGSHTWSHRNLRAMQPALAKGEVELGFSAVSRAVGHPVAPFFRFPYLSDSRAMIAHLKSCSIGMFSIEVDAVDYRTKDPQVVHNRVLGGLKAQGKGIILFHDIQPSTAGALKGLLDALAAKGYKVVHMVPKSKLKTLPEYDAIAEQQYQSRRQVAAASPLADRTIVWPNTAASAVPDEALAGNPAAVRRAALPAVPRQKPATVTAATGAAPGVPAALPQRPPVQPGTATVATAMPPPPPVAPPQQVPAPPPRTRYTNPDLDDWRQKLFNPD